MSRSTPDQRTSILARNSIVRIRGLGRSDEMALDSEWLSLHCILYCEIFKTKMSACNIRHKKKRLFVSLTSNLGQGYPCTATKDLVRVI